MGVDGKNIAATNKVSAKICKLLIGIIEYDTNIPNSTLLDNLNDEEATFLLKERFLTKGKNSDHYWDGDDYKYVEWRDNLNSFAYLSLGGLVKVSENDLKTYDISIPRIIEFLAEEFEVTSNSRIKNNEHIENLLYFVGDARLTNKKMVSVYFARNLSNPENFKKIDEFFLKQSTSILKKLILTPTCNFYPETTKTGASIISIPKLLQMANNSKKLFNLDYITNVLFGSPRDEFKPLVHCSEDGSTLFIGDKSWSIKGDKQRQIIKIMCDAYLKNPNAKIRWNAILDEADIETSSRFRDVFKRSSVVEAIDYHKGFVWFRV